MKLSLCKAKRFRKKSKESGYSRIFNNQELGDLFTLVHSASISNGFELEKIIFEFSKNNIKDLDLFINDFKMNKVEKGIFLCSREVLIKSQYKNPKIHPDLLIFTIDEISTCKVIEMKDGNTFDTKKSEAELKHLKVFSENFALKDLFDINYFICCFNQNNKDEIFKGLKKRISKEHILTGKEFCDFSNLNHEEILKYRKKDAKENILFLFKEIERIKNEIQLQSA